MQKEAKHVKQQEKCWRGYQGRSYTGLHFDTPPLGCLRLVKQNINRENIIIIFTYCVKIRKKMNNFGGQKFNANDFDGQLGG